MALVRTQCWRLPSYSRSCAPRSINSRRRTRIVASAVPISFTTDDGSRATAAEPGEVFLDVARRIDVSFELGCCNGTCGICEVEVVHYMEGESEGYTQVVRVCVEKVPEGYDKIEVRGQDDLYERSSL